VEKEVLVKQGFRFVDAHWRNGGLLVLLGKSRDFPAKPEQPAA